MLCPMLLGKSTRTTLRDASPAMALVANSFKKLRCPVMQGYSSMTVLLTMCETINAESPGLRGL